MDNFKVIYQILKYLEEAMDYENPDYAPISAKGLGLTEERWKAIVKMLANNGYIEGVSISKYMRSCERVTLFQPTITLWGLDYLHENSLMQKFVKAAKGIKDIVPML